MEIKLIASLSVLMLLASTQSAFATLSENDSTNNVWNIKTNQQVQIAADITNNQDVKQPFVYIVQVQNSEGKVMLLTWMTGLLQPHQSMSPAQSWTPTEPGIYTAHIFNWQTLVLGLPLSFPLEMKINVT